jgi:ubiquinone/menaquinone biosynthesis C-methylase UbiE
MLDRDGEGINWQVGVWDRMSDVYVQEIDQRFVPVINNLMAKSFLMSGERVIDLGTGTGAVAIVASEEVGADGHITGIDISSDMLKRAQIVLDKLAIANVSLAEGRAESIPSDDNTCDAILASLSMMYVIDRNAAAQEIARVLKPGGRFIAAVWAGPEKTDIVRFQQIAGSFAPTPPVSGVGPGALADLEPFLAQLKSAGLNASSEAENTTFQFQNFDEAWDTLAGVTTAALETDVQEQAKTAVREAMWADANAPREFHNATQFVTAIKPE